MFLHFLATVDIRGMYNNFEEAFLCIFTHTKKLGPGTVKIE